MGLLKWLSGADAQPVITPEQQAEIQRREQYWFANPFGFSCQVRWEEPRERTARAGAYDHVSGGFGLYGSVPVPFHGQFNDWGQFVIQPDRFAFVGQHCTRTIPFRKVVWVTHYTDGAVDIHFEGARGGLARVHGPVRAPVLGALVAVGQLQGSLT